MKSWECSKYPISSLTEMGHMGGPWLWSYSLVLLVSGYYWGFAYRIIYVSISLFSTLWPIPSHSIILPYITPQTHTHQHTPVAMKTWHSSWRDKTSCPKIVKTHPNNWMSEFLTKNASICQNSNHQREIKISSRTPWETFVSPIPASSQCPCLFLTVS